MSQRKLVIGGGISGLLTANLLKQNSISFIGLEKTERLGGPSITGHHRLYRSESCDLIDRYVPSLEWNLVTDASVERKKSEWQPPSGEFTDQETFFLASNFRVCSEHFESIAEKLASPVSDSFKFQHAVTEIFPDTKTVKCQDGSSFEYEQIFWTGTLESLLRIWQGDKLPLIQAMKSATESLGGINLAWELSAPLWNHPNTVVFPFRYKSYILKSLLVKSGNVLHCMLFLRPELGEDREEVAKIVRALNRELQKEFTEFKTLIQKERIGYFSPQSSEKPVELPQLEILPGLFYVGAEAFVAGGETTLRNIDQVASNVLALEIALKSAQAENTTALTDSTNQPGQPEAQS